MAVTSTYVLMRQCIIKLDNASSTLVDFSGVHTKTNIKYDMEKKNIYVHASTTPIGLSSKKPTGFDIEAVVSTSTSELFNVVALDWWFNKFGQAKTIEVYIPDTATGSYKFAGEVKLSKAPELATDAEKADAMILKFSVEEDASGALSLTIV
jgi:hypothetical protein